MDVILPLLLFIAIQLSLAGMGWWVAATQLRLSRRAALHWSSFCLLGLGAVVAGMLAPGVRDPLPIGISNLLMTAAFLAVTRGTGVFLGRTPAVWPDALALGAVALITAWDVLATVEPVLRSLLVSGMVAAILFRGVLVLARPLHAEFGVGMAVLVGGSMALSGGIFAWRMLRAAMGWVPVAQLPMSAATSENVVALLLLGTQVTLFNLALAGMAVTRLVRRLQHLSRHDGLTKLLNRRALMTALQAEIGRVRRGSGGWALLLLDVDHFKRVNDMHGHGVGDEVLRRVAGVLRASAREVDCVARMGGEEFCVLAPLTELHGGALLAERLRTAVADSAAASAGQPGETDATRGVVVTISIGVALSLPEDGRAAETPEAALARADVALYRAKAAGRNRVELATEP